MDRRILGQEITHASLARRAPGVYRQDVFPPPAPRFLTGVPVFLGYAEKGPVNEAQIVTLWPQLIDLFGTPLAGGYLGHAVRGFFENGGLICFVVRLQDGVSALNGLLSGLQAISALDTIDLVCAPDLMRFQPGEVEDLQHEVLAHCQGLRDRFAILDGPETATVAALEGHGLKGDYGALYFPWVKIDNKPTYVPPCGHVAGVYSRSDQGVGVHKAPANEAMEGVLDLRLNLKDSEQGRLNDAGVNCLRTFPGRGIRVWGARTLSEDRSWRYINVRRLFITVGRWLERFMSEVTFTPNDVRLWARIMRELTAYFEGLYSQGALKGRTVEEAFFVKCDGETNPPAVIDAGMVVTEVGLAPTTPGEFIVVRVIHGASGVTVARVL